MTTSSGLTEEQFRQRMALNGVAIEERYLPGSAKSIARALSALDRLDPEHLKTIEPAPAFGAHTRHS